MLKTILLLALLSAFTTTSRAQSFIAVVVTDIEQSAEWYADFFDVAEINRMTDSEGGTYDIRILRNDTLMVELLRLANATDRPDGYVEGLFKAGFFVPDLDLFLSNVPEGVEPRSVADDAANGVRFAQFEDPDGNLLQIFQKIE